MVITESVKCTNLGDRRSRDRELIPKHKKRQFLGLKFDIIRL